MMAMMAVAVDTGYWIVVVTMKHGDGAWWWW